MSVKWCTVALVEYWDPFTDQVDGFDASSYLDKPFSFGHDVFLRLAPDWLKEFHKIKDLPEYQREELIADKRFVFMVEYEADSLGDPDPESPRREPRSKQARALELIVLANLALWIAKPSPIGFGLVIDADCLTNRWELIRSLKFDCLIPHKRDVDNRITKVDLEKARELHTTLFALPRDKVVWIAARTLWLALKEQEWPLRYLLLWIALEALFGPEDAREITYRLSQRVAFFLAHDRGKAEEIFKAVKNGYTWRSRVVHGMKLDKLTDRMAEEIMHEVENLIRKTLNRLLTDSRLVQKFNSKHRERYLDDIIFSI